MSSFRRPAAHESSVVSEARRAASLSTVAQEGIMKSAGDADAVCWGRLPCRERREKALWGCGAGAGPADVALRDRRDDD